MDDAELRTALEQYGFSQKEAATYIAVLENSELTVSDLADEADISVRHAYDITDRLEKRGFVVIDDHVTPTIVRAASPSDPISGLRKELTSIQWELNSRLRDDSDEKDIEVVKTRETLLDRIREYVRQADDEIALSIPVEAVFEVADQLRDALDRGVFVLLLVTDVDHVPSKIGTIASAMRTWEERAPVLMTIDTQISVVAPPAMLTRSHSEKQGIWFSQYQLTPILVSAFLGNYWRSGEENYITLPSNLPAEYTEFRHAVFDASCHLKRGTDLYAEIKAKPVGEASGFETVEGRVRDTRQSINNPRSSSQAVENSLLVEVDGTVKSFGGDGAFLEDYASNRIRLSRW